MDDPTLEASILSLFGASQDARKQLVVTTVGVAEGRQSVRPAWLGRVKRPMNMSTRPFSEIHVGEDDQSEAAVSDKASPKRRRPHERGRKHLYER
jgi:hypothetical protein